MTPSTRDISKKRKRPPTFQHLPAQRAKKLKKAWVEKKKIRSKWRHEKQKDDPRQTPQLSAQAQPHDMTTSMPEAMGTSRSDVANSKDSVDSEEIFEPPPSINIEDKPSSPSQRQPRGGSPRLSLPLSKLYSSGKPSRISETRGREREAVPTRNIGKNRRKGKQPDMRTKMEHLLEKIQKKHAS